MKLDLNKTIELEKKGKLVYIDTYADFEILLVKREELEGLLGEVDVYHDDERNVLILLEFIDDDVVKVSYFKDGDFHEV